MAEPLRDGDSVGRSGESPQGRSPGAYFSKLVMGLGALGTLGIFALMLLINSDVIGRALFNSPVPGVPEMVQMGVVAIVYLQLGQALAGGRFTRSDPFYARIVRRYPRFGCALSAAFHLTGAVLMGLILAGEVPRLIEAVSQGEYFGHRGVFVAPRWPVELAIVLGCAVTAAQFLVMAWRDLRGMPGSAQPGSVAAG